MSDPLILTVNGHTPELAPDSWVAPNGAILGNVHLAARVGIWYSVTVRAESERIEVGEGSNVQDSSTLHVDPGFPMVIGSGVTVGHNAVVHGCTIEDDVLIGMGAIILNGASIGAGSVIAAGTLVKQGAVVPPRSLIAGVPGVVRRKVTDEELAHTRQSAAIYRGLIEIHRAARQAP
jgi:carbonic anhydrase/acetyltransferase-like protein (isoleucine patch superfamily)